MPLEVNLTQRFSVRDTTDRTPLPSLVDQYARTANQRFRSDGIGTDVLTAAKVKVTSVVVPAQVSGTPGSVTVTISPDTRLYAISVRRTNFNAASVTATVGGAAHTLAQLGSFTWVFGGVGITSNTTLTLSNPGATAANIEVTQLTGP